MPKFSVSRLVTFVCLSLSLAALTPEPHASTVATDIVLNEDIAAGCRVSKGTAVSPLEVSIHCAHDSQPLNVEVIEPGATSTLSGMKGHSSATTVMIRF